MDALARPLLTRSRLTCDARYTLLSRFPKQSSTTLYTLLFSTPAVRTTVLLKFYDFYFYEWNIHSPAPVHTEITPGDYSLFLYFYICYSRFLLPLLLPRTKLSSVHNNIFMLPCTLQSAPAAAAAIALFFTQCWSLWCALVLLLLLLLLLPRSGDHDGKNTNSFNVSSTTDSLKVCLHKNPNIDGDNIFVHTDTTTSQVVATRGFFLGCVRVCERPPSSPPLGRNLWWFFRKRSQKTLAALVSAAGFPYGCGRR